MVAVKMEDGQDSIMLLEKQNVGRLLRYPFSKLKNVVLEIFFNQVIFDKCL